MPLFHDPDRRYYSGWSGDPSQHELQAAQGSSEHPLSNENPCDPQSGAFTMGNTRPSSAEHFPTKLWSSDERQELIQRIKESSPWRLQYKNSDHSDELCSVPRNSGEQNAENSDDGKLAGITGPQNYLNSTHQTEGLESPADIQRPRSALHSGDFREGVVNVPPSSPRPRFIQPSPFSPHLGTSPTTPWFGTSVFPAAGQPNVGEQRPELGLQTRSRAPSLGSFSSSYVLKAPTSPLVYQANNTDLDFSSVDTEELGPEDRASRRRTLPPGSFRHLQPSPPNIRAVDIHTPFPPVGHGGDFQSHVPRRNLTSAYSLQLAPSGNTTAYRARRPSLASDLCPTAHAPMVGSYEESILRGRMSMSPSKPLDFTAQIGVLGKGKCKGHLKCPPHVTVPFPAFFYSYPTSGSGRSISDDSPSPYVGQIDLENSLPKEDPSTTRRRRRHYSPAAIDDGLQHETGAPRTPRAPSADARRRREKKNRRAESPKCPPGGCYRIPQQGQLQIIIKNPHKTAVKLFLVPYDLGDMEPGTKTFIRQRSYSAGPIIDMPLSARKNYGTDRPEASLNATENPHDKPTLRYLIHLNICCPSRGRFYLHSSIRVVFANRVPDGKEKLRNENQLPEPRYSPYKPTREPSLSTSANSRLAIEQAARRRSVGQGMIPFLREDPSEALHWTPEYMGFPESLQTDATIYNKLNKFSSGRSTSDTGESLLAKRLRGLDVHRQETFDRK
ncbi:hypothetical protein N7507_004895 [Penicillium longicatenatum]|nr:hypothetical protein N7507_004895 [Penicillium longicatenatum]